MKDKFQKLRSNSLGALCWLIITCCFYILVLGNDYKNDYSIRERAIGAILSLLSVLIVHELIHALTASIFFPGKVKINAGKDPLGFWSLRTVFPGELSKGRKIFISLAPFVVLTVVPTIVLFLGAESIFLFFIALLNCIGSYFDLIDILASLVSSS